MHLPIDDAGVKIAGARKDFDQRALTLEDLAHMTGAENSLLVTKNAIWHQPDWAALVTSGTMTPEIAARIKILRDRLPAKPRMNILQYKTKTLRRADLLLADYVTAISTTRDIYMAVRTKQDLDAAAKKIELALVPPGQHTDCDEAIHHRAQTTRGSYYGYTITAQVRISADRLLTTGWPLEKADTVSEPKRVRTGIEPNRPHLDRLERVGPDYRQGADIAPDRFIECFGYRSVQFGKSVTQKERQTVLNLGFEALHDLAWLLGIPAAKLGLFTTMDSGLGLAFGARGSGKAAAHYEPGLRVMNLTRLRGAGFAAHEFGHALDHWSGNIGAAIWDERDARYATGGHVHLKTLSTVSHLPDAQKAAWIKIVTLIRSRGITAAEEIESYKQGIAKARKMWAEDDDRRAAGILRNQTEIDKLQELDPDTVIRRINSNYINEAIKISGSAKGYWVRPIELFARAFEAWAYDKLGQAGRRSDYLVHSVSETRFAATSFRGNPYPTGDERQLLNAAIDILVDAMRDTIVR